MFDSSPPEQRLGYFDQQLNQKRQVKLKTCADVYDYWRSCKRLYKKAPKDGVEFQIDYIDTGLTLNEEQRAKAPIALTLHGAPGSYHDFALLIHHLSQQNVRVIAPNFPEYIATVKTKVLFRHSADEKAAYLRDFLKAISIQRIDLLVSHSSAIFPTLLILMNANTRSLPSINNTNKQQLVQASIENQQTNDVDDEAKEQEKGEEEEEEEKFEDAKENIDNNNDPLKGKKLAANDTASKGQKVSKRGEHNNELKIKDNRKKGSKKQSRQEVLVKFDQPIEIKAVALFNPAGHRLPKSMKPTWFKCGSVRIYQHKLGRSLFRKLGPAFLTIIGVPVRVDNMDNVMLSATVMRNSRCQRVIQQLEQLSRMKLPTLLVFSENDKLIEKEIFYEMTQFMKLDSKNFDIFNNDGDIELSQSITEDWIRVMVFKAGGHYAYSNYAKTVNTAVSELLRKVVKDPSQKEAQAESC